MRRFPSSLPSVRGHFKVGLTVYQGTRYKNKSRALARALLKTGEIH